jgi:hypothetical protein
MKHRQGFWGEGQLLLTSSTRDAMHGIGVIYFIQEVHGMMKMF